jgi:hypothetical protein
MKFFVLQILILKNKMFRLVTNHSYDLWQFNVKNTHFMKTGTIAQIVLQIFKLLNSNNNMNIATFQIFFSK